MFHPQLIMAAMNAASSYFPPLEVVSSLSTGTRALGIGISTIGTLGGLYTAWKHSSDVNGVLHKTGEAVVLASLCVGVPTLFTMIPGATGAIL